jgi:hypothetical protein
LTIHVHEAEKLSLEQIEAFLNASGAMRFEGETQVQAHIVPKERRIERLPSGYSIRAFYNHPQGRYWYVVTALEVMPTKRRRT